MEENDQSLGNHIEDNQKKHINGNNNRKNRFSGITNYELLKVVKRTNDFPIKLSINVPLESLVNFYDRFWAGEVSDDESDTSSIEDE